MIHLIQQAHRHSSTTAILANGQGYTYKQLLEDSAAFSQQLLNGQSDLAEARVAFMVEPGYDYVRVQWGIWRAGGIAVPLCITYPPASLQYVIDDTAASIIVASARYTSVLQPLVDAKNLRFIELTHPESNPPVELPDVDPARGAMILYTSGTTNLPKGVVSTHANLEAQMTTLVEAWEWQPSDHILCVLPLHHVHGIVNVIGCALWSGACCEFLPEFSPAAVFNAFQQGAINLFMAVPTIYFKLIAYWEGLPTNEQQALTNTMRSFRLMVSGSAALPVTVMEKWERVSGHVLLERYGMTEIGMAISNPYRGQRVPGHIGQPLPGVGVRLVDEENNPVADGQPGEIQVKGPTVFREYWQRPQATQEAFTPDGWFRTGDVAVVDEGSYKILGRSSVDIIKSGGYKLSALEIEEVLRTHPAIGDCGVIGLPDEEWGEIVGAVLVTKEPIDLTDLNQWMRTRMPAYKVPRHYRIVTELPRNAMGKVTKNDLKQIF
ncbi:MULTISPECIES: acyl-CoA synthetase [unclassified Spirosoma]|uniref:acyl-CoA synthetase n=1 Tax=unclassified Spirosoma TaxID=2621999 RepID=UPI000960E9B2|nr:MULTISPECIES: acyl-CoA synthetase [unclassified Spirosoma]MBN8823281.1 acyl-CoA synthetase [Spirosoma sp.]OJW72574.1 MAG: long-chain fatty acid--CoA ligase [Spirosoma sp. 48-14]